MATNETFYLFFTENFGKCKLLEWESDGDNFTVTVKCKLDDSNEDYSAFSTRFIQKFSTFSNTNWIVRSTYPNLKRLAFRKLFVCQHSSFNKKIAGERNRMRARACKASIDIKAKKINRHTCRYDENLKEGYNVTIIVQFHHSHLVNVAEAFSYLRSDSETNAAFYQYFESGMSAASAITFHEMVILEKYGKESAFQLANAQLNPSENHVYYLYKTWRDRKFGDKSGLNIDEILQHKILGLQEKGFIINSKRNPKVIVVVSPIMKRVFLSEMTNDMLFIDTTSSCDQSDTAITFVFTSSKVGALPVACAFHTSQDTSNYTLVFSMIKDALDEIDQEKKMNPAIIMTDDSAAERNALRTIFPMARLLLCCFHVGQAFWRWLCGSEHKIDISQRQWIMSAFSKLMFASDEAKAENLLKEITSNEYVKTRTNLVQHLNNIWDRKQEWCTAYRNDVLYRGSNTNNYTEASIRIFKDVVLQRCKAFNVCALIEFVANIFEKYQYRRLMKFANCRRTNISAYLKFSKHSKNVTEITRISEHQFLVESTLKGESYTVDINTACCDCISGQGGAFCKHLCAIEIQYGIILRTSPKLSKLDRISCAKLASGDEAIDDDFYQNMNDSVDSMHNSENIEPYATNSDSNISQKIGEATSATVDEKENAEFFEKYNKSLEEMEQEFQKFKNIFRLHPTPSNLKAISMFNSTLKTVNTDQQAQNMVFNNFKRKLSRKIRVQPMSVARRVITGSKSRTRIQAGRPKNRSRKRTHDLAFNVSQNLSNPK